MVFFGGGNRVDFLKNNFVSVNLQEKDLSAYTEYARNDRSFLSLVVCREGFLFLPCNN